MKKLILFLMLALNAVMASGQVNIFVPNGGRVISEEELKTYVNGWLLRVNTPNPGTDPPVDPDPSSQPCIATPTITGVSNVGKTSIRITSTGTGVTNVNWFVYKISAPGLNLKSGNVAYSTNLTIAWTGDLEPGDYGIRIEAVNCKAISTSNFIVPNIQTPTPCLSGPVIQSISTYSRTSVTFDWIGLNVPEIIWSVKQAGTVVRTGSFIPGASQTVTVTFAQIPFGSYDFQLTGLTCPTQSPTKSFTLIDNTTPSPLSSRRIYMNMTGFGFDITQANGIHPDWTPRIEAFVNMNYNGLTFKGIDGVRVNMKWFDYEPTEGVFRDDKLLAVLNWCVARGLRLSVAIIPWRREGDNMVPESHKARLVDGKVWYEEGDLPSTYKTYQPSMHSDIARNKFKNAVRHLAQTLKANAPNMVDYVSTATAQTEEFQLIRQESPLMMTGYADIDKSEWASYSGGLPVPYPANHDIMTLNAMMESSTGRKWYEYHTQGLAQFHAAFVQGVREGGMRTCGMYAGIGAPSAVYDFTYKLNTIYGAETSNQPDIIYSSEGDAGTQNSKLIATDLNMGTFPGADPAIEFDPEDVAQNQVHNPPYGVDLNGEILYNYSVSFFRRGGKIVHFAMSFREDKINQLASAVYRLRNEFIDGSSGMTGIEQGTQINFPIYRYSGLQEYRGAWGTNGGGLTKQVKIKLQNAP